MLLSTDSNKVGALANRTTEMASGRSRGGKGGRATNALCRGGAMCVCGGPRAENGFFLRMHA